VPTESDIAVIDVDWLGFFKLIVESLLSLPPLPRGILTLAVVLREHVITIGEFVVSITPVRAVCDGEGKL
jgi:hypothetical protein